MLQVLNQTIIILAMILALTKITKFCLSLYLERKEVREALKEVLSEENPGAIITEDVVDFAVKHILTNVEKISIITYTLIAIIILCNI